jgi:hypothetical protein
MSMRRSLTAGGWRSYEVQIMAASAILLVDDNRAGRASLSDTVSELGYPAGVLVTAFAGPS